MRGIDYVHVICTKLVDFLRSIRCQFMQLPMSVSLPDSVRCETRLIRNIQICHEDLLPLATKRNKMPGTVRSMPLPPM